FPDVFWVNCSQALSQSSAANFDVLPYYTQTPFSLKNTIVFPKAALPRATFSAGFSNIYFLLFLCDQTHK
ncbi:hypothetical protein, partial [Ruminococcus sp. RTP21358st1_G6_RTP21358_211008]|uniref:hypothetical protein n=1 Tax=Ruminococcus sp. RTP21358st1_G6_RTP21358_211008 TaxID=3141605 RepID=UPI0034A54C2D